MPQEEQKLNEITVYRQNLEYQTKDDDLILAIEKAVQESKDLKEEMDKIGERNKKYWKDGTEKDFTRIHPKKPKTVTNRIFIDGNFLAKYRLSSREKKNIEVEGYVEVFSKPFRKVSKLPTK